MNTNIFFYLPFFYLVKTRLWTISKFMSWLIIYLIPLLFLAIIENDFSFRLIFLFIISIILLYDFYEIGYIQNDTETIKLEKEPTLRLTKEELSFYEQNKKNIYGFRIILNILLCISLLFFIPAINIGLCEASLIILVMVYYLYNNIRNRWSIFLYFFLVSLKYCIPLFLLLDNFQISTYFLVLLIFPIIKTIEYSSKLKYGFKRLNYYVRGHLSEFRVLYYTFLSLLYGVCVYIKYVPLYFLILILYFLLYRTFILICHKKGLTPEEYMK